MKKTVVLILSLLITQTIWSNVTISSDVKNPFINEVIQITAQVPGSDQQAPNKLIVEGSDYKIIETQIIENYSYNEITKKTESKIGYRVFITLKDPGETKIKYKVENEISEELLINVRPLDINSKNLPYLKTVISNEKLFTRENGYIATYLFFDKYISANYTRPFINLNVNKLDSYYRKIIYIDETKIQYNIVSAFSFNSSIPGKYVIPESKIISNNETFIVPSYNIEVKQLPKTVVVNSIIGKSLKIEIKGLNNVCKNGEDINFSIELEGNANFSELNTLKKYFKLPEFLTESIEYREDLFRDGDMISHIKFRYKGRLNSFIGFSIKNFKVPFFNTQLEEFKYISIPNKHISGNIPALLLYATIIVVFIIIIFTIIFTIKFIKREPKLLISEHSKPAELFNFSKRETEIYIILVNGKTTKEIADELSISPETVKKHIQNILKKTNTNSRLELLALINTIK